MPSTLCDIYQRNPDTISRNEAVSDAAEKMRQRTVGSLIVIDAENKPIGIVTDRDLVIRILADRRDPIETPVIEAMTPDIVVVTAETSVSSALRLMREGTFRRLPVVDDRGCLVGIVTLDDVLMLLAREVDEIANVLQQETPAAAVYRP